jgi:hypothetical protein
LIFEEFGKYNEFDFDKDLFTFDGDVIDSLEEISNLFVDLIDKTFPFF